MLDARNFAYFFRNFQKIQTQESRNLKTLNNECVMDISKDFLSKIHTNNKLFC